MKTRVGHVVDVKERDETEKAYLYYWGSRVSRRKVVI